MCADSDCIYYLALQPPIHTMVAMPPRLGGSSKALPAPPSQTALLPTPTSGAPFDSARSLLFPDHAGPAPASGLCASRASAQVLPGPCCPGRTWLAPAAPRVLAHTSPTAERRPPPTPSSCTPSPFPALFSSLAPHYVSCSFIILSVAATEM